MQPSVYHFDSTWVSRIERGLKVTAYLSNAADHVHDPCTHPLVATASGTIKFGGYC